MKHENADLGGWIGAIIALWIFWPVGLILLIKQISKLGKAGKKTAGIGEARVISSKSATARPAPKPGKSKKKKEALPGTKMTAVLTAIGGTLAGVFGVAILTALGEAISTGIFSSYLSDLFAFSGFFAVGVACLVMAGLRRRQFSRFRNYLACIGKNETVRLSDLSAATGVGKRKLCDDLQDMLDSGILPQGYIDRTAGRLVLSDEGISDPICPPQAEERPPEQDENAILQEIREVNDAIPDQVMSEKIDRIGEITGKILNYQRSHPGKSGELRSFLNYYLPTTLKVLRAYARLDAQGIEGENISAAKKRIEGMMDQVVAGFEKQLDRLFQNDAMDITSDVEVLENMLRQDGLSGGMTMTAGSSPQQDYLDLQKVAEELKRTTEEQADSITLEL